MVDSTQNTQRKTKADIEFENTSQVVADFFKKHNKQMPKMTSGVRTEADQIRVYAEKGITDKSKIPMNSKHLDGKAIDVADSKGELGRWLIENEDKLKEAGLYIEDPSTTNGWIHFQTEKPKYGKTIFQPFPSTSTEAKGNIVKNSKKGTVGTAINEMASSEEEPIDKDSVLASLIKPFRTYHLVTSFTDIVRNDIGISTKEMNNSVQVAYPKSHSKSNYDGSEGYSGYELTRKLVADDDIDPRFIKNKIYTFHNAHQSEVDDLPMRYAKSLLVKNLEKGYDGKLVILGRAGIKPHDVIFLYDIYSDMIGPIGVRRVVQIFDTNRGWITEITPKMMAFPDNSIGAAQLNALKKVASGIAIGATELFYTDMERFCPDDFATGINAKTAETRGVYRALANELKSKEERTNAIGNNNNITGGDIADALVVKATEAGAMATVGAGAKFIVGDQGIIDDVNNVAKEYATAQKGILESKTNAKAAVNRAKFFQGSGTKGALTAVKEATGRSTGIAIESAWAAGSGATKLAGKVALRFAGPISLILMDAAIEGIINWTKYRQPILFHPLTRKGVPWYGGLRGFKDNTILESIGTKVTEWKNKAEYVRELFARHIERMQEK